MSPATRFLLTSVTGVGVIALVTAVYHGGWWLGLSLSLGLLTGTASTYRNERRRLVTDDSRWA